MPKIRGWLAAAVIVCVAAGHALPARAAIIMGQVDDFEDGGVESWVVGANSPPANVPTNIATGGPAGAADNYLRLSSNGSPSLAGGTLVVFNSDQWAGDYVAAGVNAIRMQVNNQSATDQPPLSLRLIFIGAQTLTTVTAVNVPAGGGWTTVTFPLTPGNLTGGDYATGMSSVFELNLVHSPAVISNRGFAPGIVAQLGVDNVTAVPEPGAAATGALAGAACLAISCARQRRK